MWKGKARKLGKKCDQSGRTWTEKQRITQAIEAVERIENNRFGQKNSEESNFIN